MNETATPEWVSRAEYERVRLLLARMILHYPGALYQKDRLETARFLEGKKRRIDEKYHRKYMDLMSESAAILIFNGVIVERKMPEEFANAWLRYGVCREGSARPERRRDLPGMWRQ